MTLRQWLAPLAVAVLAILSLGAATDGFRAFTSEQARRIAVVRSPQALPAVLLEDQDGVQFRLSDHAGRVVLVDFVYTHCTSLCRVAGAQLSALTQALAEDEVAHKTLVLTISFDPQRDSPGVLRAHAARLGADPEHWRFARPVVPEQVSALLKPFGVVALPDGMGDFQHNGAVHLIARDGRLAAIFDYQQLDEIVRTARAQL